MAPRGRVSARPLVRRGACPSCALAGLRCCPMAAEGARTPDEDLARGCGLRLLELSGIYERGVVRYEAGHETLAIAGLVARQRRLLRAAYLLADSDQRLEASIMLRAMLEFLIRQKWLEADPRLHYVLWVI